MAGDPGQQVHLLPGHHRRRRVEDRRRRAQLGQRLRRLLQDAVGRRHRRRAVESERRLRRHGRGVLPRQRLVRRRRLQVDRRRQDVDARSGSRPRGRSAVCSPSDQSRHRLRRGARRRLGAEPRARRLPHAGRRQDWQKVLFGSENAGAIDLVLDPANPNVLYATTLELRRYRGASAAPGPAAASTSPPTAATPGRS